MSIPHYISWLSSTPVTHFLVNIWAFAMHVANGLETWISCYDPVTKLDSKKLSVTPHLCSLATNVLLLNTPEHHCSTQSYKAICWGGIHCAWPVKVKETQQHALGSSPDPVPRCQSWRLWALCVLAVDTTLITCDYPWHEFKVVRELCQSLHRLRHSAAFVRSSVDTK